MLRMMRPDAVRDAGLRELRANEKLRKISVDDTGRPRPYETRCRLMDEYKAELKKQHRQIALECHPDRTVDLPAKEREAREERFRCVTQAVEFLMKLKPRPPQQRPIMKVMPLTARAPGVMVINLGGRAMHMGDFRWGSSSAGGYANTTTTTGDYWPWDG